MNPPSLAAYFSGANQASVTAFDDVLHDIDIGDLAAMLPTMEDKEIIWTTRHLSAPCHSPCPRGGKALGQWSSY
jgi:hypothetical protein